MSPDTDDNVDVITALMLERERYAGWLHDLEELRTKTSAHVFERVRSDYSERLNAVVEKLAGRSAEVEASIATNASRMQALRLEEQSHRDERDEAELRNAVGEFSNDQWDSLRERADAVITRLRSEQETVGAELSRLEHVLSVARPARSDVSTRTTPEIPIVTAPARNADRETTAPAPARASRDDIPVEPERPVAKAAAVAPPSNEGAATQSARNSGGVAERTITVRDTPGRVVTPGRGFDELAFLNSVMDAPETAGRTASPRRGEQPVEKSTGSAVDLTSREGLGSINSKTLKCGECGTMNMPTEWYCERCGGELSAL